MTANNQLYEPRYCPVYPNGCTRGCRGFECRAREDACINAEHRRLAVERAEERHRELLKEQARLGIAGH